MCPHITIKQSSRWVGEEKAQQGAQHFPGGSRTACFCFLQCTDGNYCHLTKVPARRPAAWSSGLRSSERYVRRNRQTKQKCNLYRLEERAVLACWGALTKRDGNTCAREGGEEKVEKKVGPTRTNAEFEVRTSRGRV